MTLFLKLYLTDLFPFSIGRLLKQINQTFQNRIQLKSIVFFFDLNEGLKISLTKDFWQRKSSNNFQGVSYCFRKIFRGLVLMDFQSISSLLCSQHKHEEYRGLMWAPCFFRGVKHFENKCYSHTTYLFPKRVIPRLLS